MEEFNIEKHLNNKDEQNIDYSKPSVDNQIVFFNALKDSGIDMFSDDMVIPEIFKNGKLNKEIFAGLLLFKAPQYILFNKKGALESIDFLEKLNQKLNNNLLKETIDYLKSQIVYLEEAENIHTDMSEKVDEVFKESENIDWLKDIKVKADVLNKGSRALLLKTKVEAFFTSAINKVYDILWKEYLVEEKSENNKSSNELPEHNN